MYRTPRASFSTRRLQDQLVFTSRTGNFKFSIILWCSLASIIPPEYSSSGVGPVMAGAEVEVELLSNTAVYIRVVSEGAKHVRPGALPASFPFHFQIQSRVPQSARHNLYKSWIGIANTHTACNSCKEDHEHHVSVTTHLALHLFTLKPFLRVSHQSQLLLDAAECT